MNEKTGSEIEKLASRQGLVSDFWYFIRHCKGWYLGPVVLVLLLVGVLMLLSGTAAAPFIYTLF